jgi:hypothetical protein
MAESIVFRLFGFFTASLTDCINCALYTQLRLERRQLLALIRNIFRSAEELTK